MMPFSGWSLKDWIVASAILIAGLVIVVLAVAVTGVYNVAASRGHPLWMHAFLELGMLRSVALHSRGIEPPPLISPDLVRLGVAVSGRIDPIAELAIEQRQFDRVVVSMKSDTAALGRGIAIGPQLQYGLRP